MGLRGAIAPASRTARAARGGRAPPRPARRRPRARPSPGRRVRRPGRRPARLPRPPGVRPDPGLVRPGSRMGIASRGALHRRPRSGPAPPAARRLEPAQLGHQALELGLSLEGAVGPAEGHRRRGRVPCRRGRRSASPAGGPPGARGPTRGPAPRPSARGATGRRRLVAPDRVGQQPAAEQRQAVAEGGSPLVARRPPPRGSAVRGSSTTSQPRSAGQARDWPRLDEVAPAELPEGQLDRGPEGRIDLQAAVDPPSAEPPGGPGDPPRLVLGEPGSRPSRAGRGSRRRPSRDARRAAPRRRAGPPRPRRPRSGPGRRPRPPRARRRSPRGERRGRRPGSPRRAVRSAAPATARARSSRTRRSASATSRRAASSSAVRAARARSKAARSWPAAWRAACSSPSSRRASARAALGGVDGRHAGPCRARAIGPRARARRRTASSASAAVRSASRRVRSRLIASSSVAWRIASS